MGLISQTLDKAVSRYQAASLPATVSTPSAATGSSSGGGFGNAVNLTLSPTAQAAVSGSSSGSGAGGPPPGGGIPITTSSTTSSDLTALIEEAKRKVIPQVGVTGASEVVDNKGDIDQVKLNELIAQQTAKAAAVNVTA